MIRIAHFLKPRGKQFGAPSQRAKILFLTPACEEEPPVGTDERARETAKIRLQVSSFWAWTQLASWLPCLGNLGCRSASWTGTPARLPSLTMGAARPTVREAGMHALM